MSQPTSPPDLEALKTHAAAAVRAAGEDLRRLSLDLHAHPELNFEESRAHEALAAAAAAAGFAVERGVFDLATAFRARGGEGGPVIAICAEYDALPEIGHACGHNLIAVAALGAALAARAALAAERAPGTIVLLGTPAEEGGGGKVELLERGALADVDAALMVHPAPTDVLRPTVSALRPLTVVYRGRNAHAAGAPWEGRNALDALVIAYTAISALRQQMAPDARVHGVITHGGDKANIIPDRTEAEFIVRAGGRRDLERLTEQVLACFQAGADASGCELEVSRPGPLYADMIHNGPIVDAYAANLEGLEAPAREIAGGFGGFSTDMGNVSYVVPSIHPLFGIPTAAGNHTPEFTTAAATEEAHTAAMTAATAMAMTALELIADPTLLSRARDDFARATAE